MLDLRSTDSLEPAGASVNSHSVENRQALSQHCHYANVRLFKSSCHTWCVMHRNGTLGNIRDPVWPLTLLPLSQSVKCAASYAMVSRESSDNAPWSPDLTDAKQDLLIKLIERQKGLLSSYLNYSLCVCSFCKLSRLWYMISTRDVGCSTAYQCCEQKS